MPYITIRVTGEPVTPQQKKQLIQDSTQMMQRILRKSPEKTWVIIEEVPSDNWGVGGEAATLALRRAAPTAVSR